MTRTVQKQRFRFSLRALLFAPLAAAVLLVLFNPRIITGHFCYITIDKLDVTDTGGLSFAYSSMRTPNTIVSSHFSSSKSSAATTGGAFTWYVRGTSSGGGGVNARRLGLDASAWHDAIKVEAGKTYRIDLGKRLVFYSLLDPATGTHNDGYIDFHEYPRR